MSDTPNRSFPDPLARWNERLSAQGYLFGEEPNAYLASQAHHLREGSGHQVMSALVGFVARKPA